MKHLEILHLIFSVLLLSQVAYGKYITEDLLSIEEDDPFSDVGIPSTSPSEKPNRECHKDILIVLDTSFSIGEANFNQEVKPFLRDFVSDKTLNVGPDGAEIALLLFSKWADPKSRNYRKKDDRTKLVIPFSEKITAESFERYINNTNWVDVEGGHTRTDKALQIANDEVYPKNSPENNRKDADDVIVLITDGSPRGTKTVLEDTLAYADELKKKGVLIIGVGVGQNIDENKFWNILKEIASPGQATRVKFNQFQSIKNSLVKRSCELPFSPGTQCECPAISIKPHYLEPGKTSTSLSWKRPDPECNAEPAKFRDFTWYPHLKSPAEFGVGKHTIHYKFYFSEGHEMNCTVVFDVRECKCPQEKQDEVKVKPGDTDVEHEWRAPVPNCLGFDSPLTSQSLCIGKHSLRYRYNVGNQFNVTCRHNIEVKGALCKGQGYDKSSQECCCGVIRDKKPGYECCGQNQYNIATHRCCDGDNIRKSDEDCPTS
ncbi:uncharacterized protein LOC114535182 isoform X2 [Dendronephthya gigantea]|uniref:uncharacterized protein LOC114535182 isoform X2 n=1 Tax=Dendronephthya gigantea TaxID=151771 RepID=UPI00106A98C9|nr:uncharacterized protein LOC114535182 isoform X2 [Dendronephthya gigantea]